VAALDRDLGLVPPGTAELALRADQDRAGLGVDERPTAPGQPAGIGLNDRDHVRGLAAEREIWRGQGRRASPGSR
jgi:hypothetical protein